MVSYWSYLFFHDIDISMVVEFFFLLVAFDGLYMIDFIGLISYPSEAFQMGFLVLTLVYPKVGLCHLVGKN